PRHVGQVCWTLKNPCCMRTTPCPPQLWQVTGLVPALAPDPEHDSQVSQVGTRISVSNPLAACSSVMSSVYFRSLPRYTWGPRCWAAPNISPNISPNTSPKPAPPIPATAAPAPMPLGSTPA